MFIRPMGHLGEGKSPYHRRSLHDTLYSFELACVSLMLPEERSPSLSYREGTEAQRV